jgi:ATP-binding cassette subfamily C protein CydC
VAMLENFYVRVVAPPLVAMVIATGMTIFLGRYDLSLAWTYLAFIFFLGIGVPLLSWTLSRRAGTELVSRRAALQARLVDGIQGLAELLAFDRGNDYSESLAKYGKDYGRTQRHLALLTGFSNALITLLVNMGMLAVLAFSIPLIATGKVSGLMLAVLTLTALAGFEAVLPLPLAAQTLSSSLQSARRLFEVVDAEPMVRDLSPVYRELLSAAPTSKHELKITNLTFSYPGQSQPALQNISFRLTPRKQIAIVGPSGAGKSTLANVLLRFWDYSDGQILLDGCDLHEFVQEHVRQQISVISQRNYFFNTTLLQNLLLARPNASGSEVQEATRRAQIHDFIIQLPKGYETIIGERGFRLSGGERQRLAIARALLKNAPIFLLDEPTANLDRLTERLILDMLFTLRSDRSLLLITHRLVGMEHMDEILVLDHGGIVERGIHTELLVTGGLYRRLWDVQNRILLDRNEA